MMQRAQELCRQLRPVLGPRIDGLWAAYLATSDNRERAELEQTFELLALRHLGRTYQPDRSPFPPPPGFSRSGDIPLGQIMYAGRRLSPFALRSDRLREHVLIAGRSGSGKTNLAFVLMRAIMGRNIRVLALDWKRSYRGMITVRGDLRVYTIGRSVSPFRFNPLIPPPGCEPHVWIKLIVDVIANAYLGGEGVISLLVAGLDHLYRAYGAFGPNPTRWPTVQELLAWLRTTKLRGRAALWQASAERILLGMTYGEFGAVLDTQNNAHVQELLDHNVVLEMDGLSNAADRVMFSEALTLYLYRYRLAQGPRDQLTNVIVLEEAHNLLLAKAPATRESMLETSIRMIRQYGIGYVFVDQSASLLSKVAFANSYATLALSQKLRADVQAMTGAMNLNDEQKEALNTLPVGTAVVRLADEQPEPILVAVPRCPIREGAATDDLVRQRMSRYSGDSSPPPAPPVELEAIRAVPPTDDKNHENIEQNVSHPPSPDTPMELPIPAPQEDDPPPGVSLSREAIRFLADVAAHRLSTTVARYQRLHLSRRRGDALRRDLLRAGAIGAVRLSTRTGQVVLFELTDAGRSLCEAGGIDPGQPGRTSLEHDYWVQRVAERFTRDGYAVALEQHIPGDGVVDVVAERSGERVAIEVETGKSDIAANLANARKNGFIRVILLATSPAAVTACQRAIAADELAGPAELWTWLDLP